MADRKRRLAKLLHGWVERSRAMRESASRHGGRTGFRLCEARMGRNEIPCGVACREGDAEAQASC